MAKHDPTLNVVFQALSDPTRRSVFERLNGGRKMTVGDLAAPFEMALPSFMKHIEILTRAGLIDTAKEGRTRVCWIRFERFERVDQWMRNQREIWEARTDRLEEFVHNMTDDDHDRD